MICPNLSEPRLFPGLLKYIIPLLLSHLASNAVHALSVWTTRIAMAAPYGEHQWCHQSEQYSNPSPSKEKHRHLPWQARPGLPHCLASKVPSTCHTAGLTGQEEAQNRPAFLLFITWSCGSLHRRHRTPHLHFHSLQSCLCLQTRSKKEIISQTEATKSTSTYINEHKLLWNGGREKVRKHRSNHCIKTL